MAGSRKLWLLFTLLTAMVANRVLAATRINSFNIVDEARIRSEHRVGRYRGGQVRYFLEQKYLSCVLPLYVVLTFFDLLHIFLVFPIFSFTFLIPLVFNPPSRRKTYIPRKSR